jgi:tetratricopeptide (TPR) repeat protein
MSFQDNGLTKGFCIAFAITFGIFVTQLTAQTTAPVRPTPSGPGSTGNVPSNPAGGPTFPGSTNPTSPTSVPSKYPGDDPHPIFITGKVQLQDGSKPERPVLIERVCNGRPHAEGYTDMHGSFSIRLGQEMDVLPDASEAGPRNTMTASNPAGGLRDSQLANCEMRAVLPGFRSESVLLSGHKYMDNPDIGTIVLRRLGTVEGLTLSATNALAPKDAQKAYEHGMDFMKKPKLEEAEREFQKAVDIYPKYAAAWYQLGMVLARRTRMDEARNAFAQSIAADSRYLRPYEQLYLIGFREKKWQEVADNTDRVLRLDPYDYPAAYYYNAVANLQLHNLVPAEKSARQSVALDTQHENPQGLYVLGVILAQKQDYDGAMQNYKAYLKAVPDAKDGDLVRKQLAQIEQMQEHAQVRAPQNQ